MGHYGHTYYGYVYGVFNASDMIPISIPYSIEKRSKYIIHIHVFNYWVCI